MKYAFLIIFFTSFLRICWLFYFSLTVLFSAPFNICLTIPPFFRICLIFDWLNMFATFNMFSKKQIRAFIIFLREGFPVLVFCIRVLLVGFTKPAYFVWAIVGPEKLLFPFNSERKALLSSTIKGFNSVFLRNMLFFLFFHTNGGTCWLIC